MKFFLVTFFALITFAPISSMGATKTVEFTWTMNDTTGVQSYKVYYAYSADMANQVWHQDCNSPTENPTNTFSMVCNNVVIDPYPVYYAIASVTSDTEVQSDSFTLPEILSSVQNFALLPPSDPNATVSLHYAINFQPATAAVPSGYEVDSGLSFDTTKGYGWKVLPESLGTRDRNSSLSPDQAYDTMIHTVPSAVWELEIPNGGYKVTICMGDPSYPTGTENVQVEGTAIINNQTLSTYNLWIEENADVQVSDGKLTITFTNSTDPARLCWIKVDSL